MAKKKKKHHGNGANPTDKYIEIEINHGIWEDYLQYGPQYDTVNDCPIIPDETRFVERTRFKKLSKDARSFLRKNMCDSVKEYWQEYRQIPVDGTLKQLRESAVKSLLDIMEIYVKDNDEVSHWLNSLVAPTINRLLKQESTSRQKPEQ